MSGRRVTRRPATPTELAQLDAQLRSGSGRLVPLGHGLLLWALVAAVLWLFWNILAGVGSKFGGWSLGWDSAVGRWLLLGAWLAWTAWCVLGLLRHRRRLTGVRQHLQQDLAGAEVDEQRLAFVAAKRFEEPEHGGLFYALRTADHRVYVHYDLAGQTLVIAGKRAEASQFQPRSTLIIARAPASGFVVGEDWSGELLQPPGTLALGVDPDRWPEHGTFCRIPWDQLERKLTRAA